MQWFVGDIKVTSIVEQDLLDIEMLIPEATPDMVNSIDWLRPSYVDANGVMLGLIQAFVVETPDATLVVDTCVGNDKERILSEHWHMQQRQFLRSFERAGYSPDGIDFVLCTHLHFDHVGWNTYLDEGEWKPTFPNASYLFAKVEMDYWASELSKPSPQVSDSASEMELMEAAFAEMSCTTHQDSVVPVFKAGLVDLVATDHVVCPGVRLVPTPGHTPGHVSVVLDSQSESAVITGDAIHHPVQIARPELRTIADVNPDESAVSRASLLTGCESLRRLVIGSHFAEPSAGFVTSDGIGFRFEANNGEAK